MKSQVADVLVSLQDPTTGLIAADSSIWEVHWDGQQKHFAYTTTTAANGLCSASRLATAAGDTADVSTYLTAGAAARDAVLHSLRAPNGTIVQSLEGLQAGSGYIDAAAIEAINLGLFDPSRGTALATLDSIKANLVPPSGRGFMRDQSGSTYDSSEWVFIDLRMERAMELIGDATDQASLFTWNTYQGYDNYGELSELHDPVTANYTGQSPMVGFGAGAYLIALAERGTPSTPTCGAFAAEPALPNDGGTTGDAASSDDGGSGSGDGGGPRRAATLARSSSPTRACPRDPPGPGATAALALRGRRRRRRRVRMLRRTARHQRAARWSSLRPLSEPLAPRDGGANERRVSVNLLSASDAPKRRTCSCRTPSLRLRAQRDSRRPR